MAIVGTRRPTMYGTQVALEIAEALARRGVIVISGLAYGIDRAAHQGCLNAGGTTIAVMAHGLDTVYPAGHAQLAGRIIEQGGALLSPYPEGTPAHKHHFLERNQWVAGLADALLVVEAEEKSGTKSTVRYALDQGKDVFAIPGPITSPQSAGPNRWLAEGAHVATSAEDILRVIAPERLTTHRSPHYDTHLQPIVTQLAMQPATLDELVTATTLAPPDVLARLTQLELLAAAVRQQDGRWALRD